MNFNVILCKFMDHPQCSYQQIHRSSHEPHDFPLQELAFIIFTKHLREKQKHLQAHCMSRYFSRNKMNKM